MLKFNIKIDPKSHEKYLETDISGKTLLVTPQLNKSTAFSNEERHELGILGKLPAAVESLEEQSMRAYMQFQQFTTKIQKNIYLRNLHDINETLFYKLVTSHVHEMIPILYTPIVGTTVTQFNLEYRRARGLYLSYPDRKYMTEIIGNRTNPEIDVIVVTDGEGVLGIGDQGIGAMDIPIAKLMVYTIAAGISPLRTLPIMLDVGTNNQSLLDNPLYLGWRHKRLSGEKYQAFIAEFITQIKSHFPDVFLHWEDFGRENARSNLDNYRYQISSFNDDIQGTGVVTLAALLAAVDTTNIPLTDQRIVVYGAGSAGIGISEQICDALVRQGLTEKEARARFWLLTRAGLLTTDAPNMTEARKPFARNPEESADWVTERPSYIGLPDVIKYVKPTVLIGCSTVGGAFTEDVIREMANHVKRPIIFPLSNPTERSEATPDDLIKWTDGRALIATGSPFEPVNYKDRVITIGQCNNALVFPGIGLGVMAVKAKVVSDDMLWAACTAAAECAPIHQNPDTPLLPELNAGREFSRNIAIAVAKQAINEGSAQVSSSRPVEEYVDDKFWRPEYLPYRKSRS